MKRTIVIALLGASILLSACGQSQHTSGGESIGALGGTAAGSQAGKSRSNAAATLAGVLLGSFTDTQWDDGDRAAVTRAAARAQTAPTGQPITWNNPQSGNSGVIVPAGDGYAPNGAYCREFRQTITTGGQQQQAQGKACQQPDGSWKSAQ